MCRLYSWPQHLQREIELDLDGRRVDVVSEGHDPVIGGGKPPASSGRATPALHLGQTDRLPGANPWIPDS